MTTAAKKSATRRVSVPAPAGPTNSPALAALTGGASAFVMLPVALLRSHPKNPRRDLGDLTELADSIRAHGVRQNLLVVPNPDEEGTYRIVIGHRRTAAAQLAGLEVLPGAIDTALSETDQVEMMLLENIQRTDLSPVEEADAYQGLLDLGLDQKAIATRTGRSRSTVAARLRLVALPEKVRAAVHVRTVTLDEAQTIGTLDKDTQADVVKSIGTHNFASTLAKASQASAQAATVKPLLDAFSVAGMRMGKKNSYDSPDGSTHETTIHTAYRTAEQIAEQIADLVPQLAAGWSWSWYYDDVRVYRPYTLGEAQERADRDARTVERDAAAAASQAARAEVAAIAKQFADLTAATRAEFLVEALTRKFSSPAITAITGFAGTYLTADPWHRFVPESTELAAWTRAIEPDGLKDLQPWNVTAAWGPPVIAAAAALAPPNRLLAALAAAMEPITANAWSRVSEPSLLSLQAHWYALLEQLGYEPSDAELSALTVRKIDPAEGADDPDDPDDDDDDYDEDES